MPENLQAKFVVLQEATLTMIRFVGVLARLGKEQDSLWPRGETSAYHSERMKPLSFINRAGAR
jgi:hypothetical protein